MNASGLSDRESAPTHQLQLHLRRASVEAEGTLADLSGSASLQLGATVVLSAWVYRSQKLESSRQPGLEESRPDVGALPMISWPQPILCIGSDECTRPGIRRPCRLLQTGPGAESTAESDFR